MTALWPQVAADLAELNRLARGALGNESWPGWAPTPGEWIRQLTVGRDGRRTMKPTWHIAGDRLVLHEPLWYSLKPLCGYECIIELPPFEHPNVYGHSTFEVGPSAADRLCRKCPQLLEKRGLGTGTLLKPWGDEGTRAHYARMGWKY